MSKERWAEILNPKRFRNATHDPDDKRSAFENDYSRILFSAAFRRLQDKTQVFPLKRGDFARTRLTHSLEVSTIARSIGLTVSKKLVEGGKLDSIYQDQIPSLLATAGLIHDIGNPPFGHYGEHVISEYSRDLFTNENHFESLSDQEKDDYQNFDGNVQGLRLITRLHYLGDANGYNLTMPTLATIIKYPSNSTTGNKKGGPLPLKKFGYFTSEKDVYENINNELKLRNKRHPLTFLLEAADDIAYSVADIEDGCKKGILSPSIVLEYLEDVQLGDDLDENFKAIQSNFRKDNTDVGVQKFRISMTGMMIKEASRKFIEEHDRILEGNFEFDLLESSNVGSLRKKLKEMSKKIFESPEVVKNEILGETIILKLLETFTESVVLKKSKKRSDKINKQISENYIKNRKNNECGSENEIYRDYQLVIDYISGMTDLYAFSLYNQFMGLES